MSISRSLATTAPESSVSQRLVEKDVPATWHYPEGDDDRDLRIDFIRGIVLFILVVVHVELVSLYNLIAWERIGTLLTWQILFVNGLAIGYHRARVWKYMKGRQGKYVFCVTGILFLLSSGLKIHPTR